MADEAMHTLGNLPLEVRYHIFAATATGHVKPKKLLRYWFEKQDAKQQIAQLAASNPDGPAPRVVYNADLYEDASEVSDDAEDGEEDAEEDGLEEDSEGADDDETDDDDEEDDEGIDEEDTDQATTGIPTLTSAFAQAQTLLPQAPAAAATVPAIPSASAGTQIADQDEIDGGDGADEEQDGMADSEDGQDEQDEAADDEGEDATAITPPPVIRVHHKWRHIPNFMRLTQCPPPVKLLLVSQQLNAEAKNWFYDVSVLRIEATASFAHTSFFEEAFSQLTEAAFSPMENIRKAKLIFVWDSTWIRADTTGCVEAIFPALLRQRADFVVKILQQAPELREITVHWHDSAQDAESTNLRVDIYERFLGLRADLKFKEHYITADAKPNRKSIAGRRRVEFQNILDNGLDHLF